MWGQPPSAVRHAKCAFWQVPEIQNKEGPGRARHQSCDNGPNTIAALAAEGQPLRTIWCRVPIPVWEGHDFSRAVGRVRTAALAAEGLNQSLLKNFARECVPSAAADTVHEVEVYQKSIAATPIRELATAVKKAAPKGRRAESKFRSKFRTPACPGTG